MSAASRGPSAVVAFLTRRSLQLWIGGLLLALVLLVGRYDWAGAYRASLLGYACSAFFLVVFLPVVYFTADHYLPHKRAVLLLTLVVGVLFTLPYRWLGLDRYSTIRSFPVDLSTPAVPLDDFDWFPAAFQNLPAIPGEGLLFTALIVAGVVMAAWQWTRPGSSRNLVPLGLGLYLLILLQSWLHLSARSPLTYAGSLVGPSAWPVHYLFPGSLGAVSGDYPVHRSIELMFMGQPGHLLLLKRSFYYYLTSQASYFFNPYYVGLVFNIFLWSAASLCAFRFVRRNWDEHTAVIVATLTASGTGFIWSVAQPASYMAGYALLAILVCLFQDLVVDARAPAQNHLLFGALLALAALVYDVIAPVYLLLIAYGVLQRVAWRRLALIVAVAGALYFGYIGLVRFGLGQSLDPSPFVVPQAHLDRRLSLILHGSIGHIYLLLTQTAVLFWGGLGNAFFILPFWLAVLGLAFTGSGRPRVTALLLFFLPLVWTLLFHSAAVVTSDNSFAYSTWPRYLYIGYLGIYVLDALVLRRLAIPEGDVQAPPVPFLRRALPYLFVALVVLINNMDVWGYQAPYFLFGFLSPTLRITP